VREVTIGPLGLAGTLHLPASASALVVFAHGSGSSRFSPRNMAAANALNALGIATLLFDLLTPDEERERSNVFDIPLLAGRLVDVVHWIDNDPELARLPLGLFGASTGAAAALVAAAHLGSRIGAVVSRGGRPDLAGAALMTVDAPTLLIVGGNDPTVLSLNQLALERLRCERQLRIVAGATHLFEETGAIEQVAQLAAEWFGLYLAQQPDAIRQTSGKLE